MGAGHAYNIDKHMLVQPEDLTEYKSHLDFVQKWKGKPFDEQLQALKETDLFFPKGVEIIAGMEILEIESNGKTIESLDIGAWVDEYYADGVEFEDGISDLKEQIVESAMKAGKEMEFDEDFGAFMDEEREGDIVVLGDGAFLLNNFSEVRFKAGLLSDNYNTGVVVFMQDAQGENYIRDIDDEDLLNIVVADFAPNIDFQPLLNMKDSLSADFIDPIFMEMAENMDRDELEAVLGERVDNFMRYVDGIEDKELQPYVDNTKFREEYANEIISRLEAAKAKVSDLFEGFADKTMDGVINSFPDETFRFATSAWTSAPYKKGEVLFSGPVKGASPKSPEPSM